MKVSSLSAFSHGICVVAALWGLAARAEGQFCPVYAPVADLGVTPGPSVGDVYTAGYAPAPIEWRYAVDPGVACAPPINTQLAACNAVCPPACQIAANAAVPGTNQTAQKPLDDAKKDDAKKEEPKPADPKSAEPEPTPAVPPEPDLEPVFIDPDADRAEPDLDRPNRQTAVRRAPLLPVPPRITPLAVKSLRSARWNTLPVREQSMASSDWRPARD